MVFEALYESMCRGELLLLDGGMCRYHLRRDGRLTIHEILVLPSRQRQGIGRRLLAILEEIPGVIELAARCPSDLPSNEWYQNQGFHLVQSTETRTGRIINLWVRSCTSTVTVGTLGL